MSDDEKAIRQLITTWMDASASGDLDGVLNLMSDDVVFIGPGRPPMRGKDAFARATRAIESRGRVEGRADVQEVHVFGNWAYCWNQLAVTMHPRGGGEPTRLAGPVLSVLRKQANGAWVIHRDANMLTPVTSEPPDPQEG